MKAALAALAIGAIAAFGLAAGATGAPSDEKASVDQRLERAQQRLQRERAREQVLTQDVAGYTQRIRALEARLAPLRERSARLEAELATLRTRLASLTSRLVVERKRLKKAEATLARRQELLGRRLRDLYVRGEPDPVLVLVESGSLAAAVEASDLVQSIAIRDGALARSVSTYADETRATRDAIAQVRTDVAASEARAQVAAEQAIAAKAELETRRAGQSKLLAGRKALLSRVADDREHIEAEAKGLAARSAALADKIRAAQGVSAGPSGSVATGAPSASGMVWPVAGTLTSGFGQRWGRMHEGIDIAAGAGTPIAAAAAGTVIVAGWNGGYGNMVVVDHGGGISTGYAHLSSISVSVGQSVGQGTVVGGMGTTGSSTGVHLHFEVRINGAATNPLGYL
jgi:murein DD-endopeptidase MepM/ murein hydrolase activator NlpD